MTHQINDDVYPGTAIAYIRATWGSQTSVGSGVLVGRNDVLTAAHVVYSAQLGRVADRVEVAFSYDPAEGSPTWYNYAHMQWFENFDPDRDGLIAAGDGRRGSLAGAESDIALIALGTAVGDRQGWFGMDPNSTGGSVGVIGHPSVYGNRMMFDAGTVRRDATNNVFNIQPDLEINGGNSGGPIYYTSAGSHYVIGLVSTASAAVALTDHYSWITSSIITNDIYLTRGQDIFRFFNSISGAHVFTANSVEARDVIERLPEFKFEGTPFGTRATSTDGVPIFRLYNSETGRHLYTASREEMRVVDARPEWAFENIAFHAYSANASGREDVHRFFQTKIGVHLYTTSEEERASIQANLPDYRYEGVAYFTDQVW